MNCFCLIAEGVMDFFFFFQAEDGIRDGRVTGVQTCALPILIQRIGTEFGISVLVCSHLLGEVERICDWLVAIDGGRLLRSAGISSMTTAQDVLAVEVSEGTPELAARLTALGLSPKADGRGLVLPLDGDDTYDLVLGAIADLGLPLHRLDQRRHRVAELFRGEPAHV